MGTITTLRHLAFSASRARVLRSFLESVCDMSRQDIFAPSVCLISRQRITGNTNGSSVYILSIVEYLKSKGFRIHYVSPSPATFGRWPFIRLLPEMDVFDTIRIR